MNESTFEIRGWAGALLAAAWAAGGLLGGGCGKTPSAADAGAGGGTLVPTAADAGVEDEVAVVDEVAAEVTLDPEAAARVKVLAALGGLELEGLARARGEVGAQVALLQFDEKTPNAKGQTGTVELSAGFCAGCAPVERAGFEARRDELKRQLGDMHAKNPGLVLDVAELELMPEKKGVAIYTRSFVVDGEARALVHTLEVQFVDNGRSVHLTAYPRSGIPATAEELAENYTRAELEALARKVFAGVSSVLWPMAANP